MPIRINEIPMTAMIVPVTTGGKKRSSELMNGATMRPNIPAAMTEPKMPPSPSSGLPAMASIGATEAKVTPIMIGRRIPNGPMPIDCMSVTMPQAKRSALTRIAICSGGSFKARPMINGTATAPGIHNQHVLQSERNELSERQALVDRMNGFCHDSPPINCPRAAPGNKMIAG